MFDFGILLKWWVVWIWIDGKLRWIKVWRKEEVKIECWEKINWWELDWKNVERILFYGFKL